jgi:ABC-type lipoprotein release transport system permease subunit
VLGAAVVVLVATTTIAATIPAMRAASVDPVKALRMQ